jgi:large subunit ribosomal protein L3
MGNENVTVQNLKVMGVRAEQNVILIKGGIPGARGSLVVIRKAIKSYKQKAA